MQVQDFWAWRDFLASRAHEHEREPLWINLDETAVAMAYPSVRGMVVSKKRWPCGKVPRQRVSRSSQRSMMTHVCLLTHDKDVQKVLPQYVISNQRSISAKMLQGMEVVPAEVIFLRRKSAWVTGKVLLQILARLVEALQKYRSKFQPILALDCVQTQRFGSCTFPLCAPTYCSQQTPIALLCTRNFLRKGFAHQRMPAVLSLQSSGCLSWWM